MATADHAHGGRARDGGGQLVRAIKQKTLRDVVGVVIDECFLDQFVKRIK